MNKCLTASFQAVWGEDLVFSDSGLFTAEALRICVFYISSMMLVLKQKSEVICP